MQDKAVAILIVVWLVAAAVAVEAGALARVPPPAVAVGLALVATLIGFFAAPARNWIRRVDARVLLLPHFIRFVGIVFLINVNRGILAPEFRPIGWGDLIAALGALVLLMVGPPRHRPAWWGWMLWNSFGLADMALLVFTGIRLGMVAPEEFTLFRTLPFGLLPTFAVPLIIATHLFIYAKLCSWRSRSDA